MPRCVRIWVRMRFVLEVLRGGPKTYRELREALKVREGLSDKASYKAVKRVLEKLTYLGVVTTYEAGSRKYYALSDLRAGLEGGGEGHSRIRRAAPQARTH